MSSYSSSSERPTLPPLHTLNLLPAPCAQHRKRGSPYDSYERTCPRLNVPQHSWPYARRVSTSTSSSTSRTPSPSPSDTSSRTSSSSSPTSPSKQKLTLVPSSFEDAEAIVVIPPPGAAHGRGQSQSLLLTGLALEHLRHPQRPLAKGTRLHPYRFARTSRRTSIASSLSSASA
ncbi:hypothetical protein B0H19DRAFT_1249530 [Mycena capillaripes]|nr:hypothetical protein B0H19DRAFT_1249530 [Mycena capillaripes]